MKPKEKPIDVTKDGYPIWGKNADGKRVCYAKKDPCACDHKLKEHVASKCTLCSCEKYRATGRDQRCMRTIVNRENGRCNSHGGKMPRGKKHYNYKDGTKSKYELPLRLRGTYENALTDKNLLGLRNDIAMIHARVQELLTLIDQEDVAQIWKDLSREFALFEVAMREGADGAIAKRLSNVRILIQRGVKDGSLWQEIRETVEGKRKLIESERKYLIESKHMMTAERVLSLLAVVGDILSVAVNRHVKDEEIKRQVLEDTASSIRNLVTRETPAMKIH